MLIVRRDQLEALQRARDDAFARRLAASLRTRHAALVRRYTAPQLAALVRAAVARADAYGLEDDDHVSAFARLIVAVGWHFDAYPPFCAFLHDPELELDPTERLDALLETATPAEFAAAAKFSAERVRARAASARSRG